MADSKGAASTKRRHLKRLPIRLHHHAYTTEDHEMTRKFYEDILGMPLVAMYIEREWLDNEWVELGHAFYGIEDGGALAFFNFADPAKQAAWQSKEQALFTHVALLVGADTQAELQHRLDNNGIHNFTIEHGYCRSLYAQDPNGLYLEFTVDPKNASGIHRQMAATAHEDLARWMRGDRKINNEWRTNEPAANSA